MAQQMPVITIEYDWNEVIRLPNSEAWISSKKLNENSVHDKLKTTVNESDGKLKITFTDNFEYVSHGSLNLVVKHISSGLKVAFIAPSKIYKVHNKGVLSVSASSEKALAVSSCEGDKLLVWDNRTGEVKLDLKGHGGPVYKCRFFPSGIVVLSASADGSCRIWSAESGINPVTLKGHTMAITDVCIIEKGRNVVSVSKDGIAKLWDVGESTCLDNITEGHGQINCCAINKTTVIGEVENKREIGTNDKLLIVGCENGLVVGTHIAKRQQTFTKQLDSACNACTVVDDSVIIGCSDGKIIQMDLKDGSIQKQWHESANPVLSMVTLPNQMFAVGRQDGSCTIISIQNNHSNIRVQLTGSDFDGIRDISCNGKWILTACRDTVVRKYDFNQVAVHFK